MEIIILQLLYGQYSYLPLSWIDLQDIDKKISSEYLENFSMIDSMSLEVEILII